MEKSPSIAVVGAGPAGLTAAVILHKHGFDVQVFEQEASPTDRSQGGSLDLHDDGGQEALRRADMLDTFRAIARHEDQATTNVDPWTGRRTQQPSPEHAGDRPEIDRGVLRDLLLAALPHTAVHWGCSIAVIEDEADGRKRLVFADQKALSADIVIGADGAWSKVRQYLTPVLPEYTGVTFLEGWLDPPSKAQDRYVGRGTMFAFGGKEAIFAQRNGYGRICIYAAIQRPRDWLESGLEHQGSHALLQSVFRNWAGELRGLLAGCRSFIDRPIYQLPVGFGWEHRDGVLLVGDASHLMPPVGVGVNLAMLDASDVALAIVKAENWREATQEAQVMINARAAKIMERAIPGFQDWFSIAEDRPE